MDHPPFPHHPQTVLRIGPKAIAGDGAIYIQLPASKSESNRALIIQARNKGTAVLLLSEDLDEIIELSDRIGVIYNGTIVYETSSSDVNIKMLGEKMAGN